MSIKPVGEIVEHDPLRSMGTRLIDVSVTKEGLVSVGLSAFLRNALTREMAEDILSAVRDCMEREFPVAN